MQGTQAQQVDFQARVCSNFVEKKYCIMLFAKFPPLGARKNVSQARGCSNFVEKKRSATTGCANNAEPISELYLRGLDDAGYHTRGNEMNTARRPNALLTCRLFVF